MAKDHISYRQRTLTFWKSLYAIGAISADTFKQVRKLKQFQVRRGPMPYVRLPHGSTVEPNYDGTWTFRGPNCRADRDAVRNHADASDWHRQAYWDSRAYAPKTF